MVPWAKFSSEQCIMQWYPVHVGTDGNQAAKGLAKEARHLNKELIPHVTLSYIHSVAKSKLNHNRVEHQIYELNTSRTLATTLIRLRARHFWGWIFRRIEQEHTLTAVADTVSTQN